MYTPSDLVLLQQWQTHQDAHAFKTLTQRYGGLVFGICNRVLKNPADAEEITQECFLKLAQQPGSVERSLGPWLHSVAVNASVSRIRAEQRRRAREAVHESARPSSVDYSAQDLLEHVDEAISQLPEAQRHCVVGYFLEGKPRHVVADELGVSTKTIQRKTDEAIEKIREILGRRGITSSAGALAATMAGLKAEALPVGLEISLGKIAVAGRANAAARAVAVKTVTQGGISVMKFIKAIAALVALVSGVALWQLFSQESETAPQASPIEEPVATFDSVAEVFPTDSSVDDIARVEAVSDVTASPADVGAMIPDGALIAVTSIPPIPNPTHYAEVAGVVADENGAPVAHAEVTLFVAGLPYAECDTLRLAGYPTAPDPTNADLGFRWCNDGMAAAFDASGHRFVTVSDENGAFVLAGIRYTGAALIAARTEGFAVAYRNTEVSEVRNPDLPLTLRAANALHGRVVAADGAAIAGARVTAVGTSASSGGGGGGGSVSPLPTAIQELTDTEGNFTLWLANADRASVRVDAEREQRNIFHDLPVGSDELQTLKLSVDTGTLSGKVVHASGDPARHYFVHVMGMIGAFDKPFKAESAMRGVSQSFTSGKVASGGAGRSGGGGSFGGGGGGSGGGDALSAPPVFQFPAEGSRFAVETDDEGRFLLESLPVQESYEVMVYDGAGRKVAVAALPPLSAGVTNEWSCVVEAPVRVAGRVIGVPSGKGLAAVSVSGDIVGDIDGKMDPESAATQADGTFALDFFTGEGTYEISAFLGHSPGSPAPEGSIARVTLGHDEVQDLVLELPDPWSIQLRATDPTGSPVEGASATLNFQLSDGGNMSEMLKETTDAAGRLRISNLDPGAEMQVAISAPGFLNGQSSWIKGEAGVEANEETVLLYPIASAMLRILDAAAQPMADTKVLCAVLYGENKRRVVEATSDGDGWVTFSGSLPAGAISLEVRVAAPPGAGGMSFGGSGDLPPAMIERMAGWAWTSAERAGKPSGSISAVMLAADEVNDIGELRLTTESEAAEP